MVSLFGRELPGLGLDLKTFNGLTAGFGRSFGGNGMQSGGFNYSSPQLPSFNTEGLRAMGFDPRGFQAAGFNPQGIRGSSFNPSGIQAGSFDPRGFRGASFSPQGITPSGFEVSSDPFGLFGQKAKGQPGDGLEPTSGQGAGFIGSGTASDNEGITAQQIDGVVASYQQAAGAPVPLAGRGADILRIANQYGVSVPVLLAIAKKESGMGSNVGAGNIFGITDPSCDGGLGGKRCFQKYANPMEEVAAAARLLSSSTYRGKSVQDQISTWYVGKPYAEARSQDDLAGNGTVDDYVNGVRQMYGAFGKQSDTSALPTARAGKTGTGGKLGSCVFPVEGYTGQVKTHHDSGELGATDIFGARGANIRAAGGGTVTYSGYDETGGYAVGVRDASTGLEYWYAHMQGPPSVSAGQTIQAGTHIGQLGETGNAAGTGAHLHFGMGYGIISGTGPQGGAGKNFDAVGFLNNLQSGKGCTA